MAGPSRIRHFASNQQLTKNEPYLILFPDFFTAVT